MITFEIDISIYTDSFKMEIDSRSQDMYSSHEMVWSFPFNTF